MKYKIAYIDEQESSIVNFYSHFHKEYDLHIEKVDDSKSVKIIIDNCFEQKVDVIITDYKLEEEAGVSFNGNDIFNEIKGRRPHFPIVMLTSWELDAIDNMENVHVIYSKDILDGSSQLQLEIFNTKVKNSINNYRILMDKVKNRMFELTSIKKHKALTPSEEEELDSLFVKYDELYPEEKDIPTHLNKAENISQLNNFVNEARELLLELKKINKDEF